MGDVASTTLDGNALAGLFASVFGEELTTAVATCGSCGASGEVARAVVYVRGPGTVARCETCTSVIMVFVTVREITCVDLRGLAALDRSG